MAVKCCSGCKVSKELDNFHIRRGSVDGRAYRCKQCVIVYHRNYHSKNKEKSQLRFNEYYRDNAPRIKKLQKKWKAANRDKRNEYQARRRASKLLATPSWYEKEHLEIVAIYKEAKSLGNHVDHIAPLNSPIVCGLHTLSNLQILTPEENMKKSNKHCADHTI
tara:strand:+ start:196 stop:684 length:489 start_codon:yes stop_codon:yes gene_type:complete